MKIQSSSIYSQFSSNPHQRAFKPHKVDELVTRMKENGFVPSMAISVYRGRPGELIINTGHHRLAAAKRLGIPVLYVIENQWTLKQMVDEGTVGDRWSIVAVAQSFARAGNRHYQDLLAYADRGLPIGMAASLLIGEGASSGNARSKVSKGTFKIKARDQADKILEIIDNFGEKTPAVKSRAFISSLSKCLFTPEFDPSIFERRMRANPLMLEKTSNEDQMIKQIDEIYNFKSPKKIPLAFLVNANSESRKATFGGGGGEQAA